MKKIFNLILLLGVLIVFPYGTQASDTLNEELKLFIGETKIIPTRNPTRIAIGNPAIADVSNVSKSEMTITPKAAGKTTLVYWDSFGEQSYKIKVLAEDLAIIKGRIDNLLSKLNLPEVRSQVEEEEGKVFILGRVKSSSDRERVITALGALKDKIVDLMQVKEEEAVLDIAVQVVELNNDATDILGFTWPGSINFTEIGSPGLAAAGTTWGKVFKVAQVGRQSGGTAVPFTLQLDALVQEGKAQILSRPRLACQSGKEAELAVGGEKPIFTTEIAGTSGAAGTSVEYKEYGIKLKIKPTLTEEKRVKLTVNVEVSEIGTVETLGSATTTTASAYPLSKRAASTELFLDNGQTMVIGGLMKKKSSEDIRKVPFLGDLPFVGAIFRKKTITKGGGQGERGDTELFITLTPTIVSEEKKSAEQNKVTARIAQTPVKENTPVDPVVDYAKLIQARILNNCIYPQALKDSGYQGIVKLSLRFSYTGELVDVAVKESSGYQLLDEQAMATARNSGPYPPFPPGIKEEGLTLDIPINYQAEDNG